MSKVPEASLKAERFLSWAREHGAYVHPSLHLALVRGCGYGWVVKPDSSPVSQGQTLFRVPYGITLSYLHAVCAGEGLVTSPYRPHATPLPAKFLETTIDHDTVNAVFLVQQHLLRQDSFWYPYLQVLPQPDGHDAAAMPFLWTAEDTAYLRGTHLEEAVNKQQKSLRSRWSQAVSVLGEAGWDTSKYTPRLSASARDMGMWAYYVLFSRYFWSTALEPDIENVKSLYRPLVEQGISLEYTPKVLVPVLDSFNHWQGADPDYDLGPQELSLSTTTSFAPGEQVCIPYDKPTEKIGNTGLLLDFGFVLPDNMAREMAFPYPAPDKLDISKALHQQHQIFSTASTLDGPNTTTEEAHRALVTVRALSDTRGALNAALQPDRVLQHFHPTLVSMVSFKEATLPELAMLSRRPDRVPSLRNRQATVHFLIAYLRAWQSELARAEVQLGEPTNERQRRALAYRTEQGEMLAEFLASIDENTPEK